MKEHMAKLTDLSLDDLYGRKITSSVETVIRIKDDFSKKSENWCNKVCKLNCKSPPLDRYLVPDNHVDVLIVQDYRAFDEPRFWKRGEVIEKKHLEIIDHMAKIALRDNDGKLLTYGVTTLLKCAVTPADIKGGKAPTDIILSKCHPYLLKEIELRKPKVIISLANAVTKVLGFKKSNYRNRGEIQLTTDNVPVVITGHPRKLMMLRQNSTGQMWGPDFYDMVLNDFRKASGIINGSIPLPNMAAALARASDQIEIARSIEDVVRFTKELYDAGKQASILSYDTETSSLDPYLPTAKLITVQFGYRPEPGKPIRSIVFPMWHKGNTWYDPNEAWKHIAPILSADDILKIGHNLKFDIIYTYVVTGLRIKGIFFDTMLLLHSINSGVQGMYGLKQAVHDWLPESGLAGYEEQLPPLYKPPRAKKVSDEEEELEEDDVIIEEGEN